MKNNVIACNQEADATLTLANVVKPTSVSWEQRATSNILKGDGEEQRLAPITVSHCMKVELNLH